MQSFVISFLWYKYTSPIILSLTISKLLKSIILSTLSYLPLPSSFRMKVEICLLLLFLQTVSWVCESSRPGIISPSPLYMETSEQMVVGEKESEIGSSPPSCYDKCYGCSPCEATQVPTSNNIGIQYANYEPEGWKCKCGPAFYSP